MDLLLQVWLLASLLALVVRSIVKVFKGVFNKHIFIISWLLGFLFGSIGWLSFSYLPRVFSAPLPGLFYLFSLFLWEVTLLWGCVKIRGNLLLGGMVTSFFLIFFSWLTVLSLRTEAINLMVTAYSREWLCLCLIISIIFLSWFWVYQEE